MKDIKIELNDDTNTSRICYTIYLANKLAGTFCILITNKFHLDDIFIEKDFRRKGIGKYLIDHFKINSLNCTTWNEVGITFYKSIGFKEIERDPYLITFGRN